MLFFHSTLINLIHAFFFNFSSFSKNKQKSKKGDSDKNPFGEDGKETGKIEESNPFAEESSVTKNPFASGECLIFLDFNLKGYL